MKKRTIALALLTAMTLAACGNNGTAAPEPGVNKQVDIPYKGSGNSQDLTKDITTLKAPDTAISSEQVSALSVAGTKLFADTVAAEDPHANVLLSPISVALAFGMVEGGANGNTLSQMEAVIGGGNSADDMNSLLYNLSDRMKNAKDVNWNVANSLWFKDDGSWEIDPDFVSKAASWYDAKLWKAPFDDTTVTDINGWVNSQTRGMIPGIINNIPDQARMYIINALAFEAEWLNEYIDTQILEDQDFTNADGSTTKVTMLCSGESKYFELNGAYGFLRDYKGREYSFMGLLPEEGTDLNDYIKELGDSGADLSNAIRNIQYGDVVVQIPEFKNDYDVEMSTVLQAMGMTDAFDREKADLTGMMKPVSGDDYQVWIDQVLHKTHIEVDRKGTRAAAVTAVVVTEGCTSEEPYIPPIYVILDRPFIYGIIDNATGLPVFLGCMNQM